MRGVIQDPAWPAAAVRKRCQPADATPTPVANAIAAPAWSSGSEAAMAANEAIVSGLRSVTAKKRT